MIKKFLAPLFLVLLLQINISSQRLFSEEELKSDLHFYKINLERQHPNLYLYAPKDQINFFFDSISNSINKPLTEAEFYSKITLSSNIVKDGHTLILPSNSFTDYHNTHSKFLPFQIGFVDQNLYVKMNCTKTKLLEDGTIIDSINGLAASSIIEKLLKRQVRDGKNLSYAKWILDTYFREYYSYQFGHPSSFQISYTNSDRKYTVITSALPKDSIYFYRQKNDLYLNSKTQNEKGIDLKYDSTKRVAILTIKDFHTDILKSEYNQNFIKEIKNILNSIIKSKAQNLVIDLRNNQGGDVENGVYLLKYLIPKPFKVVNQYEKIKNGRLVAAKGPSMGIHTPFKNQFKGKIYVLLNGGSFSNSVIFSSCLRENTNTVFVGTESGGNPHVLAGYAKDFELPNTKINVQIPTKRFIMTNIQKNDGSGLLPTYMVDSSIEHFLLQKDNQFDFLLDIIYKNEN
ncbi:MAG: hypothetical protein IPN73_00725 [Saprospiraceae bacterium]|nr:hypothetical protein [Saprospiraceae bacterium]MBK8111579.1 hypothetical protein [Saprospiraceae bacterium]MBK8848660.1 hypothetical protein [Saprospiraceae bacterium]